MESKGFDVFRVFVVIGLIFVMGFLCYQVQKQGQLIAELNRVPEKTNVFLTVESNKSVVVVNACGKGQWPVHHMDEAGSVLVDCITPAGFDLQQVIPGLEPQHQGLNVGSRD